MIDERVAKWRELVPYPLAESAASSICGEECDKACEDCIELATEILAHVYAYNAHAKVDNPCPACQFTRKHPTKDLFETCVFHEGEDQGMLRGWKPTGPVRITVKPPRSSWWMLTPKQNLILSAILMVAWVAMLVWVIVEP